MNNSNNNQSKRSFFNIWKRVDNVLVGGTFLQFTLFLLINIVVIGSIWFVATLVSRFNGAIISDNCGWESLWRIVCYFLDPGQIHEETLVAGKECAVAAGSVRIATPIIAFLGMVLTSGLLVTILINTVERRVGRVERGEVTYKNIRNHIVVIGYNNITLSVIRNIFKPYEKNLSDAPTIVMMSTQPVDMIHSAMMAHIKDSYNKKIIIYSGNIEAKEQIARLNIDTAREVYILGEQEDNGRDVRSLECVKMVAKYRKTAVGKELLKVNVQVDRLPSYTLLQKLNMKKEYIYYCSEDGKIESTPNIYFRPFSFYENWARLLWSNYHSEELKYDTLDFETMRNDKHVHLIIVGFNRMGRALLMEALRICHYYNYDEKSGANRTKITVIDNQLDELRMLFDIQYPHLKQIKDINIEYKSARIEGAQMQKLIDEAARDESKLLTVAICIKDPDLGISIGLNLPESVYYQPDKIITDTTKGSDTKNTTLKNSVRPRVLIRQEMLKGIGNILSEKSETSPYKNVKIFGMLELGVNNDLLNDDMAIFVNAQYDKTIDGEDDTHLYDSAKRGDITEINRLFNSYKLSWAALAENMRWSNRYQIDIYNTYIKELKLCGVEKFEQIYLLDDTTKLHLAQIEHRRWIAERSIMGWRQVGEGEVRNNEFFIHDQIKPFADLDAEEKVKDDSVIRHVLQLSEIIKTKNGSNITLQSNGSETLPVWH